eukprot:22352_4
MVDWMSSAPHQTELFLTQILPQTNPLPMANLCQKTHPCDKAFLPVMRRQKKLKLSGTSWKKELYTQTLHTSGCGTSSLASL